MHRLTAVVLVALACLLAAPAAAQTRVTFESRFVPPSAKPGDEVVLELDVEVEEGFHVYGKKDPSEPLTVKLVDAQGLVAVGEPDFPDGEPHTAFGDTNYWLGGSFKWKQKYTVPATASGELRVSAMLRYIACNESFCDPPAKEAFSVKLAVAGAPAAPPATKGAGGQGAGAGSSLLGTGKVALRSKLVPAVAKPGDTVTLELECTIQDGYHLYGKKDAQPPKLAIADAGGLELQGDYEFPDGVEHKGFETNYWVSGTAVYKQAFTVPKTAVNGPLRLRGALDYLACTEEFCDPAAKAPFTATLTIEGGAAAGAATPTVPVEPDVKPDPPKTQPLPAGKLRQPKYTIDDVGDELGGSLWSLILLCIGGGLIALAMPCTYPMIPITFSFFTKQAAQRQGSVLPLALAYGIGIVLIFVTIGAAVGEVITQFAAHWATNLVIGGAFVVFAMSLFGFFVLQPPAFVNRLAGSAGSTGGLLGVFLMGATLVISSFTCTAPIVGSLLASVATAGRGRVVFGMAIFGLTMAAPFVLLALLPGRLKKLPKSGDWMNTLKVALGFVELAAALKFFSNVDVALGLGLVPRELFLFAWAFAFTLLALFLFGMFGYRQVPVEGVSSARNAAGVASLAFAFYCIAGGSGLALDPVMTAFEPPYRLRPIDEHEIVYDNHREAMAIAAKEKRWVLVNFTDFT